MAKYFYPVLKKIENRTSKERGQESYFLPEPLHGEDAAWLKVVDKQRELKSPVYQVDGDGNPILDGDGNPVQAVDGNGDPIFNISFEDYKEIEVDAALKTSVLADRASQDAANQAAEDARKQAIADLKAKGPADLTTLNDIRDAVIELRDLLL